MLALKRVSSLIVTLSESGRALQGAEVAYLDQLVAGLHCYPDYAQRHFSALSKYAPLQHPVKVTCSHANLLLSNVESYNFSFKFDNASAFELPPPDVSVGRVPQGRASSSLNTEMTKVNNLHR